MSSMLSSSPRVSWFNDDLWPQVPINIQFRFANDINSFSKGILVRKVSFVMVVNIISCFSSIISLLDGPQ